MKSGIYPEEHKILLDNYAMSNFRTCPRKFKYRIHERLVPGGDMFAAPVPEGVTPEPQPTPPELLFGIAIHKAMDELWIGHGVDAAKEAFLNRFQPVPEDRKRTPLRGEELIEGYADRWAWELSQIETCQNEIKFSQKIGEIDVEDKHGKAAWEVYGGGVIDKLFTLKDRDDLFYVCDHKTSSWESESLIPSFNLHSQFMGYVAGAASFIPDACECSTCVADILCIYPKNNKYYRSDILFHHEVLSEWRENILQTARMIMDCYERDTWPMYGRDACTGWNKLCPYFDICDASKNFRPQVVTSLFTESAWDVDAR